MHVSPYTLVHVDLYADGRCRERQLFGSGARRRPGDPGAWRVRGWWRRTGAASARRFWSAHPGTVWACAAVPVRGRSADRSRSPVCDPLVGGWVWCACCAAGVRGEVWASDNGEVWAFDNSDSRERFFR
ncbi:hypothetical protein GCM10023335_67430 [Streptomyces siamensis]|uniref:Uncharacterized protein n=1 Tax=Streptomyces siamensis TaxID=1274986 RepID=A0ABP9JGN7_9ACTN